MAMQQVNGEWVQVVNYGANVFACNGVTVKPVVTCPDCKGTNATTGTDHDGEGEGNPVNWISCPDCGHFDQEGGFERRQKLQAERYGMPDPKPQWGCYGGCVVTCECVGY